MTPRIWDRLTLLRGATAFYVLLHHIRNGLWWLLSDIGHLKGTWFYKVNAALAFLLWQGLAAVLIFFVVSGISIHASQCGPAARKLEALPFYRRRARRIYPALIASMIIGLIVLPLLGEQLHLKTLVEEGVGTLLFLQTVITPSFAGNLPYWSLANEGWYYAFYPLLLPVILWLGCGRVVAMISMAVVALSLVVPGLHVIVAYYPIWLVGAWVAEKLVEGRRPSMPTVLAAVVMFLIFASAQYVKKAHPILDGPAVPCLGGVGVGVLLWKALTMDAWHVPAMVKSAGIKLGDMSYSLYLVHFPIVRIFEHLRHHEDYSLLKALGMSLGAIAASLMLARFAYVFVECPFLRKTSFRFEAIP